MNRKLGFIPVCLFVLAGCSGGDSSPGTGVVIDGEVAGPTISIEPEIPDVLAAADPTPIATPIAGVPNGYKPPMVDKADPKTGFSISPVELVAGRVYELKILNPDSAVVGRDVLYETNASSTDLVIDQHERRNFIVGYTDGVYTIRAWFNRVKYIDTLVRVIDETPPPALFCGGDGSEQKPYLICTVQHLDMARNYPTSHFRLENDLDLTGITFRPIGHRQASFDGNGRLIKGWSFNFDPQGDFYDVGFFRFINDGVVKNFRLEVDSLTLTNTWNVAALVGHLGPNGRLLNSTVSVSGTVSAAGSVGALVGFANGGTAILDSSVLRASVSCTPSNLATPPFPPFNVGGAIGFMGPAGTVDNLAVANVTVSNLVQEAGGAIGAADGAQLSNISIANATVTGRTMVGGFAANLYGANTISSITVPSSVTVNGLSQVIGGFAGQISGGAFSLIQSNATVVASNAETASMVGGIAGRVSIFGGTSVSFNRVSTGSSLSGAFDFAGGFIGTINSDGSAALQISDSTSTAQLNSSLGLTPNMAGLVGGTVHQPLSVTNFVSNTAAASGNCLLTPPGGYDPATTFSNVYMNADLCAPGASVPGVVALTSAGMASQASFSGLDFVNTWIMTPAYPALRF